MAQSELEICNSALSKLGCRTLLAAVETNGATQEERVCALRVDICKRAVLAMHPWNFAIKRIILPVWSSITDCYSSSVVGHEGEIQLDDSFGPVKDGDTIEVRNVEGTTEANGRWVVDAVGSTVVLVDSVFVNTWTTDTGEWRLVNDENCAFDYDYCRYLPTDCLRVLRVNDSQISPDWRIESGKVMTNDEEVNLKYLSDVTDYTLMPPLFYEALATYLAWDISLELGRDNSTKEQLGRDFKELLSKARFVDATEDPAEQIEASDWVASRVVYRGSISDPRNW